MPYLTTMTYRNGSTYRGLARTLPRFILDSSSDSAPPALVEGDAAGAAD